MKKNSTLNKTKIAGYTAVASAIVASGAANAQATYSDINPDVVADSLNPYLMDLNNDATPELQFGVAHQEFTYAGYDVIGALAYVGLAPGAAIVSSDTATAAAALDCGIPVSQASIFGTGSYGSLGYSLTLPAISYTVTGGNFLGANDKMLGLKFTAGANTHYGWVKLSLSADATTITIKEYGFNATPDSTSNTCDQGVANLVENLQNNVSIQTTLNSATVKVASELIGGTVNLVNMAGQTVQTVKITDVNTTVNFEGLQSGIYTVVASFKEGMVNRKVYVK